MALKSRKQKEKSKKTLSQALTGMISIMCGFIIALIVFVTSEGLDFIYLAYAAVETFFASYEIEEAFNENGDSFFEKMDFCENEYGISVELYDSEGKFVYSSAYKDEMSAPPYNSNSIKLPQSVQKNYELVQNLGELENNSFKISQDTSSSRNTMYLVGEWKTESGITIRIFRIKSTVDTNAKIAVTFISVVTFFVVLAALIVFTKVIRRITKPLGEMSEITKNMSSLDFSQKCEQNKIAEISDLSESINEMSESLETALLDLQQKNKKLQDDIEQEKTIDRLRQVFISGVSHELKTPIAIIQGYSEGLKVFLESDPETAMKYCDTIINETERMNNLVMKLLDIIKYESGEYQVFYEDFSVYELIEDWYERNAEIFREKGINAVNLIDKELCCSGDRFILSSVVNNFLSNAVSHVDNEMEIRASAVETENGRYRISIFNTGKPIESKDIDQIWNSFYRADKAMSRAQGRFGLGLAIVAAIQKLHSEEYGVINHENGVEFWFDVKKKN